MSNGVWGALQSRIGVKDGWPECLIKLTQRGHFWYNNLGIYIEGTLRGVAPAKPLFGPAAAQIGG